MSELLGNLLKLLASSEATIALLMVAGMGLGWLLHTLIGGAPLAPLVIVGAVLGGALGIGLAVRRARR